MKEVLRNWRVLLLIAGLVFSSFLLLFQGLEFGVDFKGGTLFQVQLDEKPSPEKMGTITSIISERLDGFGLKDTKVFSLGEDLIAAQIAETEPRKIEQLERLLKTQGRFEATLDGEVLFEGSGILQIFKDPARGYGVRGAVDGSGRNVFGWQLPFLLNEKAAGSFSKKVFHRCTATSFDPSTGTSYDCESTFFFIDRPKGALLVVPETVYSNDTQLLAAGNEFKGIPPSTSIDLLAQNADVNLLLVDVNGEFSAEEARQLQSVGRGVKAVVHDTVPQSQREFLSSLGFKVTEVTEKNERVPWVWTATGARQVISITPGIANLDPYVEDEKDARVFSELIITGSAPAQENAKAELKGLEVLFVTGSLPIGIRNISKESISPLLGGEFLSNTLLIGIVALVFVALVVFVRYRNLKISLPIIMTGVSEILIILGVVSFFRVNLDLAAVTGILASVGTGVDHQIIIMDELLKGGRGQEEETSSMSYGERVKRAFFIIFAAAATAIVTMLPIIIFSFGVGKLRGFALTTVIGVLIGVLITRPAFAQFAQYLLKRNVQAQN